MHVTPSMIVLSELAAQPNVVLNRPLDSERSPLCALDEQDTANEPPELMHTIIESLSLTSLAL